MSTVPSLTPNYDIHWTEVPVFICNRNRLELGFRQLVTWLLRIGMKSINVVDNQSTYPPLLEFYSQNADRINVLVQDSNLGPRGFWQKKGLHKGIATPYIYTDCDIVPSDYTPDDVIEQMLDLLKRQDRDRKVGVGLRIDNLPDHYCKKELVIRWESHYWDAERKQQVNNEYANGQTAFNADVDTTFAMYHPGKEFTYTSLRMDAPYAFEHAPWYIDESKPTEEDIYYKVHYETEHQGEWPLYGWSIRTKESLDNCLRMRGYEPVHRTT